MNEERSRWLSGLPEVVRSVADRWAITLDPPIADGATCSWVAPARRADGSLAVLKVGMPHMEGEREADALLFWDGDPTVRLLEVDASHGAMLLERARPGTPLGRLPEPDQDVVIADILRRMWRTPPDPHPFRPLADMTAYWRQETLERPENWIDSGLVRTGLDLFTELPRTADAHVLLATDLHAGNVLMAERKPWLAIDPKPFVGDPAYDATQHLLNCDVRLSTDPLGLVRRMADLLDCDPERVRLWTFARIAAENDEYRDPAWKERVARALAP